MPSVTTKPVIFLAFANDRDDRESYLRNLPAELRNIRAELEGNGNGRLWELVERTNATAGEVVDVFQRSDYRDHVAIFHYGGHASSYELMFESGSGHPAAADADSLAAFFGNARGLQLVFLNGCATHGHIQKLLDANVSAVIATTRAIEDEAAKKFATRFYRGLANGASVQVAFDEAAAATRLEAGGRTRDVYHVEPTDDRWPWELHFRPGAEVAGQWNLAEAAGDPLFGLPLVPPGDLPTKPYRHLHRFTRQHAEVFFGRGHEIRELYEFVASVETAPIVFLYGDSGIGKSSLLEAGLLPRLERSHEVCYLRRDRSKGLSTTLHDGLRSNQVDASTAESWRSVEAASEKPLIVILDQVEEAFTLSGETELNELRDFVSALGELFRDPRGRPAGKLLLGFRKEWLAEVEDRFTEHKLPHKKVFLDRLNRDGIVEAVNGPAQVARLAEHYGLTIEDDLPEVIADDLLADPASPVAPTLQILLAKMWTEARKNDADAPEFDRTLYERLKREGLLLQDFLREQLGALRSWRPDVVDTGLALDLLARHTTDLGTAASCRVDELRMAYSHRLDILPDLLQQCKDHYLLVEYSQAGDGQPFASSLTHDTLAPLVRKQLRDSDLAGSRALRVLQNRVVEWEDGATGASLDESDLATVEKGALGMRAWTEDEQRLIEASRRDRGTKQRRRRGVRVGAVAALVLVLSFGAVAWKSEQTKREAAEASLIITAVESLGDDSDPLLKALLLAELQRPPDPSRAASLAIAALNTAVPRTVLGGDAAPVTSAAFDSSGTRVVTGHEDGTVRVWSINSAGEPSSLPGHADQVNSVEFSPDGTQVVTASSDGTAQVLWADGSGAPFPLEGHTGSVRKATFSPDGARVVTASLDGTARVWWTNESQDPVILQGHSGQVSSAEFSPDGSQVVTASTDGTARIWSADGSDEKTVLAGHEGAVSMARFDPAGKRVVTGSEDATARVWALDGSGESIVLDGHQGPVYTVAFSHEGSRVVTGSDDRTARIWRADGSSSPVVLSGHEDQVWDVAFGPADTLVVTASADGTARVWRWITARSSSFVLRGHASGVTNVALTSDGTQILTASQDGTVRVWSSSEPRSATRVLTDHQDAVLSIDFSSDGSLMVTTSDDGTARLWPVGGASESVPLRGHNSTVLTASFSPDNKRVVTASSDRTARIWLVESGQEERSLTGHEGVVNSAFFSPDGAHVLTASYDGTARIWDVGGPNHRVVVEGRGKSVTVGRFGPGGQWLTWTDRGETHVGRGVGDGERVVLWRQGIVAAVRHASFSPDGRLVVTASDDGAARVWHVDGTGEPVPLEGHSAPVRHAVFSPDGSTIVTTSHDKTARVWRSDGEGDPVILAGHERVVRTARFSRDGSRIVSASDDNTARVWPADGSGDPIVLVGHRAGVTDAAFDRHGSVVTVSKDGTVRVWELKLDRLLDRIRQLTTFCLEVDQRQTYLAEPVAVADQKFRQCVGSRKSQSSRERVG